MSKKKEINFDISDYDDTLFVREVVHDCTHIIKYGDHSIRVSAAVDLKAELHSLAEKLMSSEFLDNEVSHGNYSVRLSDNDWMFSNRVHVNRFRKKLDRICTCLFELEAKISMHNFSHGLNILMLKRKMICRYLRFIESSLQWAVSRNYMENGHKKVLVSFTPYYKESYYLVLKKYLRKELDSINKKLSLVNSSSSIELSFDPAQFDSFSLY